MANTTPLFQGFPNYNMPGFPYQNQIQQLLASMQPPQGLPSYGRFGNMPTLPSTAQVPQWAPPSGGQMPPPGMQSPPTPAGANDPGFGAGMNPPMNLPSNAGGAPIQSNAVQPSGLTMGSNALGIDPTSGRQILRAPDGSTRLGARPLAAFTPQQFTQTLQSDPQAAYWMLARGGAPAQQSMMQATGMNQQGINQFINSYAPGIGQVYGYNGWIPTR